jgi:hypothetical protein
MPAVALVQLYLDSVPHWHIPATSGMLIVASHYACSSSEALPLSLAGIRASSKQGAPRYILLIF